MRNLWSTICQRARLFPAAALLLGVNLVLEILLIWEVVEGDRPFLCLFGSCLGIGFSVLAGLWSEMREWPVRSRKALVGQGLALVLSAAVVGAFWNYGRLEDHFLLSAVLSGVSLAAVAAMMIGWNRRAVDVVPSALFALLVAGTVAVGVAGGLSLVVGAAHHLFNLDLSFQIYALFWTAGFSIVGFGVFVTLVTRREDFAYPRIWKALQAFVAMPVFILLVIVLWAYLFSRVIVWNLPNGEIHALVTAASCLWLAQHLLVAPLETKTVLFFRRFGAILILPLLGLQVCALALRIEAYGLSPMRYASCYVPLFFAIVGLAALVRRGAIERLIWPVVVAVALFAAFSPWNIVDVGVRAQVERLAAYSARQAAGEAFKLDEKCRIMDTWDFVRQYDLVNGSYRRNKNGYYPDPAEIQSFEATWGFAYVTKYERSRSGEAAKRYHYVYIASPQWQTLDIAPFTRLHRCRLERHGARLFLRTAFDQEPQIDIDELFRAHLTNTTKRVEGLVLELPDGRRVFFLNGSVEFEVEGDAWSLSHANGEAWLLECE